MEANPAKELLDRIVNRHEIAEKEHGETIRRYEQAGRISRWLIRRSNPEAVRYFEYLQAQQSVRDAIRDASRDPHNEVPLSTAA